MIKGRSSHAAILLLCMHACAYTLICTFTSKAPWGLIKAACALSPSFAMSPLPQGPKTDTGIIGLNTPTARWEWLRLDKWDVCAHVGGFDPVNAAQLAGEWLVSQRISGCWWRWWGRTSPGNGTLVPSYSLLLLPVSQWHRKKRLQLHNKF